MTEQTTQLSDPSADTDETQGPGTALMAAPLALDTALEDSNPVHFELMSRMAQLEEALLARDPMMKMHLAAVHKQLIQHEELVHLLKDEEMGRIVAAQQSHTNTSLVQEVSGKTGKAKVAARAAKLGLDDL